MKKPKKIAKGSQTRSAKKSQSPQSPKSSAKGTTLDKSVGNSSICGSVTFHDVTKIHPALKASFGYCLFKGSSIYKAKLEDAIRILGINVHHLALLSVLSTDKSTNQNQMCDELGIDKASMVKLIDHIEKQKLVERVPCATDRRVKYLHVTPIGLSTLTKARKIRETIEEDFMKPLTDAEKATLRSVLPRLIEQG